VTKMMYAENLALQRCRPPRRCRQFAAAPARAETRWREACGAQARGQSLRRVEEGSEE